MPGLPMVKSSRIKSFYLDFLGSSPDRGPSPVQWGDFPSVHSSICRYVPPWTIQPGLSRHARYISSSGPVDRYTTLFRITGTALCHRVHTGRPKSLLIVTYIRKEETEDEEEKIQNVIKDPIKTTLSMEKSLETFQRNAAIVSCTKKRARCIKEIMSVAFSIFRCVHASL